MLDYGRKILSVNGPYHGLDVVFSVGSRADSTSYSQMRTGRL